MPLRLLLSAASGVLFALSFPNASIGWLAFIALIPVIVASVQARSGWQAFLYGWIAMSTAWLLMVPWVVRVMSYYGGLPYALGVALFVALALILGLYGGLFTALVKRYQLGARFLPWLLVPLTWAAIEYLRTYFLTGFPWNLIATALIDYPSLIQLDRFGGPYFLGALLLLPATAAAWWITQRPTGIARVLVVGSVAIVLLVWWGTGLVASKLIARTSGGAMTKVALLQPNITQQMRWDETQVLTIYKQMIGMTVEAADHGAQIIIWPESTVPLSFTESDFFRESIESLSKERNVDIILGSVATDPRDVTKLWNSAFLVGNGKTIGHYDKIRLVPFGEYVPLRRVIFFAEKLVRAVGDFQFGTNDRPLAGRYAYGLAICYEIVFPQITRAQVNNGADVLVTITNDAWYDGTSAPAQHLWQARLRAVEGNRYLLRAATTGISAFVDPTGRMISSIPMGKQGIIYAEFEGRTALTPYVRWGDWFAWGASGVVVIALIRRRMQNAEFRMKN